ncbi:MAG: nucleotidyltransferase domain-containing protein [Kiritimatiellaeota bacterium]|nr:nucleotidyltransferase domain-containing protein [Kiritimatiellota bacterium]
MNSSETQPASEIAARAKAALCDEPGLKLAILYGSAATGKMRADSDVDIALLFDQPLNAEKKMELMSRLESELQRDVDLVDLFNLSGTILKQVLSKGRVLIQTKPRALAKLTQRMIYNQADMMPYVSRTLIERQRRFIHG